MSAIGLVRPDYLKVQQGDAGTQLVGFDFHNHDQFRTRLINPSAQRQFLEGSQFRNVKKGPLAPSALAQTSGVSIKR